MTKGLSLEELRNNLEGEAQKKVKELEEEQNALRNSINAKDMQIRHLQGAIEKKEKEQYYLFNRCYALTHGNLCMYCGREIQFNCMMSRHKFGKFVGIDTMAKKAEEILLGRCHKIVDEYEKLHPEEVLKDVEPK